MTPEVRQFAAQNEFPIQAADEASRREASENEILGPNLHQRSPTTDCDSSFDSSLSGVASGESHVAPVEWKPFSGRLPADVLRAFKQLCLEREMWGLRPYRQQEVLAEAVSDLLRKKGNTRSPATPL
jgi:hypothetical protein